VTDHQNDQSFTVLAALWANVLGVKKVEPDDNFFALGGHSLLGVRLITAIREKLNLGEELKISDLADHPTLADFAEHLRSLALSAQETGEI
jgi:hypothetical protein